eukprot:5865-Prymnesium_polylepis.1
MGSPSTRLFIRLALLPVIASGMVACALNLTTGYVYRLHTPGGTLSTVPSGILYVIYSFQVKVCWKLKFHVSVTGSST